MHPSAAGPPASPAVRPLAGRAVLVTGAGGGHRQPSDRTPRGGRCDGASLPALRLPSDLGCLGLIPAETRRPVDVVFGDLRDEDAVREAMRGMEIVFHLGALIAIPYSYPASPGTSWKPTSSGRCNVLMAARAISAPRVVIHTSTSEVYGTAVRVPSTKHHPLQGQSPYSASKIGADKLVESFVRSFDVPAVTIRPFNTYGPRQSARAIIPTIISQALVAWRVVPRRSDTERDFTCVTDTVDGFVRAAVAEGVLARSSTSEAARSAASAELVEIGRTHDRPSRNRSDGSRPRPPGRKRGPSPPRRRSQGPWPCWGGTPRVSPRRTGFDKGPSTGCAGIPHTSPRIVTPYESRHPRRGTRTRLAPTPPSFPKPLLPARARGRFSTSSSGSCSVTRSPTSPSRSATSRS